MRSLKFKKPTHRQLMRLFFYSVIIVLGNMVAAGASAFFIIPNNFTMGGTTGFGIFVRNLITKLHGETSWTEWVVSITTYAVNIALFVIGAILLGKKFVVTTLAGTILYPTFLTIFGVVNEAVVQANGAPLGASEPLLAAVMGGLLFGCGVGIVVRVGASTGGTDIPPLIFHKFFNWPVSVTLWVLDIAIVAIQLFVVKIDLVLYGVVITLISSLMIDKVAPIGMKRMQVKIISTKYEEIRDMILTKISRGVTVLYGQTGYLKQDCHMLLTIVSQRQLVALKAEVQRIDPEAFITIGVVSEVRGRGFHSDGVDFLMPQERDNPNLPENLASSAAQPEAPADVPAVPPVTPPADVPSSGERG